MANAVKESASASGEMKKAAGPKEGKWMLDEDDPARDVVVRLGKLLAGKLEIDGDPDKAAHELGNVLLRGGKLVKAHVLHAVDPVITDGKRVVMINRGADPGMGKPALPGGFIDPEDVTAESAIKASAREAVEEVGMELDETTAQRVGTRNFDRPYDIRVAIDDRLEKYGISQGDIFLVSTQAVRFDVDGDLTKTRLVAGDDAQPNSARCVDLNKITPDYVGIPDHYDMIKTAMDEKGIRVGAGVQPASSGPTAAPGAGI